MDYAPAEQDDAKRDVIALIRAMHDGDDEAYEVILDQAGDRGRRAIAESLVHFSYDQVLRLLLATVQLPDDAQEFIIGAANATLRDVPGAVSAVTHYLTATQASLAADAGKAPDQG